MEEIFNAKKTSILMMRDRGYTISPDEEQVLDLDQLPGHFTDRIQLLHALAMNYRHVLRPEYTILRFTSSYEGEGHSVSTKTIQQYTGDIAQERRNHPDLKIYFVLIGDSPNNNNITTAMNGVGADAWQYFELEELQSSPVAHVSQPVYTKLSPEQDKEKTKELKTTPNGVDGMLETDPVARWYWYKAGDLIMIERDYEVIDAFTPIRVNYRRVLRAL